MGAPSALALASGGVVDSMLPSPADPQLAGIVLLQQLVLLAVDARFAFVENTSRDALSVTIGTSQVGIDVDS